MIKHYCKIRDKISKVLSDSNLHSINLTTTDDKEIADLLPKLEEFDSVAKLLQRENLDMADVRMVFDGVIQKYPLTSVYLSATADIVHSPVFESAIVKIQNSETQSISFDETESVLSLKLEKSSTTSAEVTEASDFASMLIKKRRLSTANEFYMKTTFLKPTSDVAELAELALHAERPNLQSWLYIQQVTAEPAAN